MSATAANIHIQDTTLDALNLELESIDQKLKKNEAEIVQLKTKYNQFNTDRNRNIECHREAKNAIDEHNAELQSAKEARDSAKESYDRAQQGTLRFIC